MKQLKQSWQLNCSTERYWRVFLDEEYSRALYLDGFKYRDYRVLLCNASARNLYIAPRLNLPGPVAKLVGDSFAYEQHGTLDGAYASMFGDVAETAEPERGHRRGSGGGRGGRHV